MYYTMQSSSHYSGRRVRRDDPVCDVFASCDILCIMRNDYVR